MANQKPVGAVPQELTDALALIDQATTAVATEVTRLRDQVKTSMTPEEVAQFKGSMDDVATRLKGIAVDPANPVPVFAKKRP